jgi:uncharacterized secreted protein with C-terminal beta-propeller domain
MQKTVVHRIAIDNGNIEYKANGEVPGYVLNQFSMDEQDGYFRIATTTRNEWWGPGPLGMGIAATRTQVLTTQNQVQAAESSASQEPQSSNNVYVLDSDLKIVGSLENLAPGESIYSARFIGNRCYLVTFKSIDPLFVIDLSDPANPKVLGQLKIPGFSDYLHPYDETHIIGVGKEVDESIDADKVHSPNAVYYTAVGGVKLSLFDVSDVSNPKEIAKIAIGYTGTDSEALRDHKAFLFSKDKNLLVIPILLINEPFKDFGVRPVTWQGAYVFSTSLDTGFTLKGRITHAPSNATNDYYYYYGPYSVTRSLYIDNVLYTISEKSIKMNALDTLNEIKSVELPTPQEQIYPIAK